jgi:hypothetical protein
MIDFSNAAVGFSLDSGFAAWLASIRLLANLAIVVAIASVVFVLYSLSHRNASELPAPRRLIVGFAAGMTVCGIVHLARTLGWGSPPDLRPGSTSMRVAFAAFWVAFAVQLPAVIGRLVRPLSKLRLSSLYDQSMKDLASLAEYSRTRAQTIELFAINESGLLDQTERSRQIGDILNEMEMDHCKT